MSSAILLSDGEAAVLIRMLPVRLVRLAKAGLVPHVVLPDGEVRFVEHDLREWVDQFRRPARATREALCR